MTAEAFKNRYDLVTNPGKVELVVRSVSNEMMNPNLPNGPQIRIVNFYAIAPHQFTNEVKAQYKSGTVDVGSLKTMSFNVPANGRIPAKNEKVEVTVGFVNSKTNGEVLGCLAMNVPQAQTVSKSNWDIFVSKEEPKEKDVIFSTEDDERTF